MYSVIKGIKIDGVAAGVPNRWLSLDEQYADIPEMDEKTLKKFKRSTGVEGRYVSTAKQTNSDWCYAAAERILSEKNIDRNKIGVVIYVSQTADYRKPATAMVLQHRLGIGIDCLAFDINLGCSGFVCGLNTAASILLTSDAEYALLMCGETAGREKVPEDKPVADTEKMLFGDAGSAALLKKDDEAPDICFVLNSDGNRFKDLIDPWGFYRNPVKLKELPDIEDGVAVFNFSTNEVPDQIIELMNRLHRTPDDYDYLVLHQANRLIMSQIDKKTGFSQDKSVRSIAKYANTSSASIPVTLVENFAGREAKTLHIMTSGYGIGLSWAAADCYIDTKDIMPLVETDNYYEDGYQTDK